MPAGILYVMAKSPRPGSVKTRLCPPLTSRQASQLAQAFAADTMASVSRLPDIEVRLALDDGVGTAGAAPDGPPGGGCVADSQADLRSLARGYAMATETQGEGDLGARMQGVLARGLATGAATVLIGTDSPDLPRGLVTSAFDALGRVDVVLAPARDGGYVLIGARCAIAGLFDVDAPWSSARVFEATCRALERTGCSFEALRAWDDVDDAAALGRLASRLNAGGAPVATTTARLLAQWRLEGVRF